MFAMFISRWLNHCTKNNMFLKPWLFFFFLFPNWKQSSASGIWIITLHALRFLPSDAAEHSVAGVAGSAYLKRVFLMPAGSWRARLLDNYPQEYQNPPPKSVTSLQMHSTSPVAVFKQCFRVNPSFHDEPPLSPVLPPNARAWEGAQKERT